MKKIRFAVTDIDWCVEDEDVIETGDETADEIEKLIAKTKASLPKKMTVSIDCDSQTDIDDAICDELSNFEGFLVNRFNYKKIK